MIAELSIAALVFAFLQAGKSKSKPSSPTGPGPGPYHPPGPTPQKPDGPQVPKPTPTGPKTITPTNPPPGSRIFGKPTGPVSGAVVTGDLAHWGNWIMVAKDCSWVIEGPYLWHLPNLPPSGSSAIEADTLAATLAIPDGEGRGGNNIEGFLDALENAGMSVDEAAQQVVKEAAPQCAAVGPQFWAPAMRLWYQNLRGKIAVWREGIEFLEQVHTPASGTGKPNCADIYLHDDKLDEARTIVAELHEQSAKAVLGKLVELAAPGCNPFAAQMTIHILHKGKRAWIHRSAFDAAAGNATIAEIQNGDRELDLDMAVFYEAKDTPHDLIDLYLLLREGI